MSDEILFYGVGDIAPDRADPRDCFALVRDRLREADLAFCQLEVNITERGFRLATDPKITMPTEEKEVEELLAGKSDLTYTVAIEVVPPIALADFKTFKVEKPVADVTDAEVDDAVKRIAEQNRSFAEKGDGAKAASGDRVTVSFKGTIDGTAFEGGAAENIPVTIGSNTFIPGFEDQLIGIATGETRTLKVTFPENYGNKELAGKAAEFETTASKIESPQELTINDEFANTDVALVIGANDVVNPAARTDKSSPIYGMPILNADKAKKVYVVKRGQGKGYAGIVNALFYGDNCDMVYGDAAAVLTKMIEAVRALGTKAAA